VRYVSLPVERLAGMVRTAEPLVILDSASAAAPGRYSYVFSEPLTILTAATREQLPALWRALTYWQSRAWLAGYVSYEAAYGLEPRLSRITRQGPLPLAWFAVCSEPAVFDHVTGSFAQPLELAPVTAQRTMSRDRGRVVEWKPRISRRAYGEKVAQVRELIAQGEVYQLNLTYGVTVRTSLDDLSLYQRLREEQAVAYAAYLQHDGCCVLSFSPELFFAVDGRKIRVKPMKGTASRGRTPEEDAACQIRLADDQKNRAENVMIVDLLRNDLGRVCEAGSIEVRELCAVEQHRTVLQMTSTITGRLRAGTNLSAIFAALFPSGSVTGAPKLRAMELIDELEDEPRGPYCGALGFSSPRGEAVFSVPIRTLVRDATQTQWRYGVGSGLVWESDEEAEWQECQTKTAFLDETGGSFSLVETMYFDGSFAFVEAHHHRLSASARFWGVSFSRRSWKAALAQVEAVTQGDPPVMVRLCVDQQGRVSWHLADLDQAPWPSLPAPIRIERLQVAQTSPFLYHKTTHCPWYEKARAAARRGEVFDVVFVNQRGELTEGARSNLFAQIQGTLFTPPLRCGLLPGVLRAELVRAGQCIERVLTLGDLQQAQRLFCGSAVRGLVPVSVVRS